MKKTLTKQDIEELANYLIEHLGKRGWIDHALFFYNNKMVRIRNMGEETPSLILEVVENIDPHKYTEYAAYEHILTIIFDGCELYDKLNYGNGFPKFIEDKFEKLGIYHELGHSYDITFANCYSDEEHPIEYTHYERPLPPINLYMVDIENAPLAIQPIMKEWYGRSKATGDIGCCVLCAGFTFQYQSKKYHLSPCSPWQGECSWTPHIEWVEEELKKIGATDISWHYGSMD